MIHRIQYPDGLAGRELRTIVWDDEAGTVDGDHSNVDQIRVCLRQKMIELPPVTIQEFADPAHDPSEFLTVVAATHRGTANLAPEAILPATLKGIEPRPLDIPELPEHAVG